MSVTHPMPLIGVPADVREVGIHPFHGVGEKYINAVAHGAGALPLLLPAFGPGRDLASLVGHVDVEDLVARLDGLFLPGSPSNVEPHHYGGEASAPATAHDPQRDASTLPLIEAALDAALPLFAVCRGFQELNVALGGTLHQRVQDVPGLIDHREDKSLPRGRQYAPAHSVRLAPGGLLAGLAGTDEIEVNSLHDQGIDRLADRLVAEAVSPDGLVEGAHVRDAPGFTLGVQWHPEWRVRDNPVSLALFEAFGDAARARAAARPHHTAHGRVA
ncbi:MAG: gamma-glutamyl-gamma-aminobutyrate hydrolase family protein [Alphaproteobacteria bacterium]